MGMNFLQPFRILMLARFSAEQTKDLETMLPFGHEGAIVRTGYNLPQPLIVLAPAHSTASTVSLMQKPARRVGGYPGAPSHRSFNPEMG
jgi:hypothetical protein